MSFLIHPKVSNQRSVIENGRNVLIADTSVALDCNDHNFSRFARDQLEKEQARVARRYGYDEVRLGQI